MARAYISMKWELKHQISGFETPPFNPLSEFECGYRVKSFTIQTLTSLLLNHSTIVKNHWANLDKLTWSGKKCLILKNCRVWTDFGLDGSMRRATWMRRAHVFLHWVMRPNAPRRPSVPRRLPTRRAAKLQHIWPPNFVFALPQSESDFLDVFGMKMESWNIKIIYMQRIWHLDFKNSFCNVWNFGTFTLKLRFAHKSS